MNLSIEQLKKTDGIHIQDGKDPYGVAEDFEVLLYNEDLADNGYPAVPSYIPVKEAPKGFTRLVFTVVRRCIHSTGARTTSGCIMPCW
ncbi:MAG: hypothetical protein MUO63_22800 [Desulfobulbaceae bacterium]|nr:hypothetical protein [Desulfobulbaceae bacterium]